ncbi:MAG TPA: Asp-tRNA(Asn)/Glu-tRNA(Gln) amidotransferase GatCAB subunit C, partial [Microscillaceae bacterium]|nr:Asp-tRNA(Asn)/Glu-tRNA(Gln) amidotransferase GatCAB subunit C [Microscillaceae bacterium]
TPLLDTNQLQTLAHRARLHLPQAQEAAMLDALNQILEWAAKLNELNTDDITPLHHISEVVNAWREDEIVRFFTDNQGLQNAPQVEMNHFVVPNIIA